MDQEDLSYRKWPFEDGFFGRKQFKNPLQVQILEDAYEVNQNPTSRMKEDLAQRTGLDFMQVQSWFGNRRYYDRHGPRRYKPRKDDNVPPGGGKSVQVNSEFDHPASVAGPSLISGSLRASETCVFLNPKPLRSFMPPGTSMAMPVPPPTTQSHSFPMHQPHCVVTHAENELKGPLGDDTPVFANFKHLTSGGFQSPLVNMERTRALRLAPQSCSPKKIQRAWLESNKPLTFSGTLECRCSTMPFNETAARVGDVHMLDVEHPRAVQEQQFFPQKSNWFQGYQNASHTLFPVSSVNTSHCRGQTSKGCAYAFSPFPYQCETSNAANSSHQADDHPMPHLGNSSYSIPIENNFCSIEKEKQIHLDGSSKFRNFEHVRVSAATTPYQNRNQKDRKPVQNQRRYPSNGLHHKRSYDRYIVMPRKGSETSVNGANQVSYFSNVDNNFRLIVAKWNSKEGRAVYTEGDSDMTPSMSSGTDTTLSDDYHEEATANVKDHAEGKSPVVINLDTESEATRNVKNQAKGKFIEVIDIDDDEEYHAGEYQNAQQSIVVLNGDGDWEMEDAGYKEDKDSRDQNVGINEHVMASPVSSEHTL